MKRKLAPIEKVKNKNKVKINYQIHVDRNKRYTRPVNELDLTEIAHYHEFNEISIIFNVSPGVVHYIESEEGKFEGYDVKQGDIFVINNQKHYFELPQKREEQFMDLATIMYSSKLVESMEDLISHKLTGYNLFKKGTHLSKEKSKKTALRLSTNDLFIVSGLHNSLIEEYTHKLPGYEIILEAKLKELLTYLSRIYQTKNQQEIKSIDVFENLIDEVTTNLDFNWRVPELAFKYGFSTRSFTRKFLQYKSITFHEFLEDSRLEETKKLLLETEKSISDIAEDVGLHQNTIRKKFIRKTGMTPESYRKANKK